MSPFKGGTIDSEEIIKGLKNDTDNSNCRKFNNPGQKSMSDTQMKIFSVIIITLTVLAIVYTMYLILKKYY